MQTPDNINLTVMATIGVAYMQRHEDPALRIMQLETIVAALSALLQCVGRPPFMNSIFHLWSGLTHSLVIFEHMLFPEQEIQTNTARALPQAITVDSYTKADAAGRQFLLDDGSGNFCRAMTGRLENV